MNYFQQRWSVENNLVIPYGDVLANRQIDLTEHLKKVKGLDYIPWAVSLQYLFEYNPDLAVGFEQTVDEIDFWTIQAKDDEEPQGTYIKPFIYSMSTGKRTPAITYASRTRRTEVTSNDVSEIVNSMMRALARVIAEKVGIGWSVYSRIDESIPSDDDAPRTRKTVKHRDDFADMF